MLDTNAPLSRRSFFVAAGATGVAFSFSGLVHAATGAAYEPTIWYNIAPDGIVTVNIIRAEMGQHVGTALARILAD